jgi:ergothioneine biosynthesis protein EgtB
MASPSVSPEDLEAAWARSDAVFDLVATRALLERPIALRQPFLFYVGHLPAFAWNQLWRGRLGRPAFAPELDALFERGIDPVDTADYRPSETERWPSLDDALRYRDRVRRELRGVMDVLVASEGPIVATVLEHELMHHETLLYMVQQLAHEDQRPPVAGPTAGPAGPAAPRRVRIPAGTVTLGAPREGSGFGWDNEFPESHVSVEAFEIDATPVRNSEFLEFVDAGGYRNRRLWDEESWDWLGRQGRCHPLSWRRDGERWLVRALFADVPFESAADWPACVSACEADAFALWRGQRLPTEAEFQRAAHVTPDGSLREHPWGSDVPAPVHGRFGWRHWSPAPVGSHPAGSSAWGVLDLVGNGWEWTSTPFAPFPGFEPMPHYAGYSRDFFDGRHVVALGASWATDDRLVRRTFRNWYQRHYPYVFSKFRCVASGGRIDPA